MSHFDVWAQLRGVPRLPASIANVAQFVSECAHLSPDILDAELAEIDEQHERLGYAPPAKARAVIEAFDKAYPVTPPRSWPSDKKTLFAVLPHSLKIYLEWRQREQDQAVQNAQREAAELRNKLKRIESKNAENKAAA